MPTWKTETDFWTQVVRYGLPRFRWFRPATPFAIVDKELHSHPEWDALRSKIQPDDKIWPFRFPRSNRYWGKKFGYVVLRRNQLIGGIVTISE